MLTEIIGFFIAILTLVYIYYKYVIFNFWRKSGVFYVDPVVPTGNVTDYVFGKKSIGEILQDFYVKYKHHRIVGMYMFYKPNLLITDVDLIRTVFVKEFRNFHDRGMFCNEKIDAFSSNLITLGGKKWRNLRFKLSPTFTSGKLKQMLQILKECGEEFTKSLESKARTKDSIDIKDMFGRYTTDIIMTAAFGIKSNTVSDSNNEFRHMVLEMYEISGMLNAMFIFAPQILEFFSISINRHSTIKFFTELFRNNVEYRKTHNMVKNDFMNLLIQLMEKGYVEPADDEDTVDESTNTNKLTMSEAASHAFFFFIAGAETSSSIGTFCLYELAQNQDIQDKVRQEINETLSKHGGLTYDGMNEMTYLHQVVQETMRKYPPLPMLNRICTKEIVLPTTNVRMPEGMRITIPVLGIHRDPSIYPDPDKFDPERFNADQMAKRHPYAYLPFGEGPRNCIGARFGYMQTKIGIISVLSRFKLKLHPQTPVPLAFRKATFVLAAKSAVQLIVETQ